MPNGVAMMPGPGGPTMPVHPDAPDGDGAPGSDSRLDFDMDTKTIRVIGPIVEQLAHNFRKVLTEMDMVSRVAAHMPGAVKAPPGWADRPITVEIDSPGGDLYAGLLMYTEMRRIPSKVRTVALRHASSAALVLLVGGDERVTYPHILAVDHQLSTGYQGTLQQFVNFVDHIKGLQAEVNEIFDKHTGGKMPADVQAAVINGDVFLNAEELKKYGFVDDILAVYEPGAKPAVLPPPDNVPMVARTTPAAGRQRAAVLEVLPGGRDGAQEAPAAQLSRPAAENSLTA